MMLGTRFVPGWMTEECERALLAIDVEGRTRNTGLKRRTVILMADGLARGESKQAVLGREDTCAGSTWYGKDRRRVAWKDEPEIVAALGLCHKAALKWEDQRTERAVTEARRKMELEAPINVGAMSEARIGLMGLGHNAEDEAVQVKAFVEAAGVAGKMLDRTGPGLESRSRMEVRMAHYTAEELAEELERARRELEEWEAENGAESWGEVGGLDRGAEHAGGGEEADRV